MATYGRYDGDNEDTSWVNVLSFNADPGGVNDCSTQLQRAINTAESVGAPVYFPAGTFNIGSTGLTCNTNMIADPGAVISYSGTGAAITVGDVVNSYTTGLRLQLPRINHTHNPLSDNSYKAGSIGVKASNVRGCYFEFNIIAQFETALMVTNPTNTTATAGSIGNTFVHLNSADNKRDFVLQCGALGWVNDNTFIGGRVNKGTTIIDAIANGFRHVLIDGNGQSRINGNRWYGTMFEGGVGSDLSDYWVEVIDGSENLWHWCRWEPNSSEPAPKWHWNSSGGTGAVGDSLYTKWNEVIGGAAEAPNQTNTGASASANHIIRNRLAYTADHLSPVGTMYPADSYHLGMRYDLNQEMGLVVNNFHATQTAKGPGLMLKAGPSVTDYGQAEFRLYGSTHANTDYAGRTVWALADAGGSEDPAGFAIKSEDANDNLIIHPPTHFKNGPVYDVKAFGAKGDGTSDDTTAIQNALTAAGGSNCVYIPAGTYKITSALTIVNGQVIHGAGRGSIIKQVTAAEDGIKNATGDRLYYVTIKDINIMSGVASSTGIGLNLQDVNDSHFSHIYISRESTSYGFQKGIRVYTPGDVKSATIAAAGTGYAVNDTLTVAGGTGTAATFNVDSVGGSGEVTGISLVSGGDYTVHASSPNSVTGGTGSGCQLTLAWGGCWRNHFYNVDVYPRADTTSVAFESDSKSTNSLQAANSNRIWGGELKGFTGVGLKMYRCNDFLVDGVTFEGDYSEAILVGGNATENHITHCRFELTSGDGVKFEAGAQKNFVLANHWSSFGGGGTQISDSAGINSVIESGQGTPVNLLRGDLVCGTSPADLSTGFVGIPARVVGVRTSTSGDTLGFAAITDDANDRRCFLTIDDTANEVNIGGAAATTNPTVNIKIGTVTTGKFDSDATAGNTRFLIYDVDNATLERVSVGAADSGGAGFKLLRIPN